MTAATWLLLALAGGLGAVTRFEVDSRVGASSRRDVSEGARLMHPQPPSQARAAACSSRFPWARSWSTSAPVCCSAS